MPELPEVRRVEQFVREAELSCQEVCWVITDDKLYFFYKNELGAVSELLKTEYLYDCCREEYRNMAQLFQWGVYSE